MKCLFIVLFMNKKKHILSFLSCILAFVSSFVFQNIQARERPIITITVMKAGSHLLNKCISLLTKGKKFFYLHDLKQNLPHILLKDNQFCYTHIAHTKVREQWLKKDNFTCFYMYRDPRDQLVSLVFYLYVAPSWRKQVHPVFNKPIDQIPFNDLLMDLITDGSWLYNLIASSSGIKSVEAFYRVTLPWLIMPSICVLKFEELIGPRGGGTEEMQLRSIQKIARHLGIKNIKRQKLLSIVHELFGSAAPFGAQLSHGALEVAPNITMHRTFEHFREGKIGSWKKHFTQEHKQVFKQVAGKLLIDLGYEKDLNW